MNVFEITIWYEHKGRWPVHVKLIQPNNLTAHNKGFLNLDEDKLAELRSLDLEHKHKEYGELLGKALFYDEVRDAFMKAFYKSNQNLRIFLVVESPKLKTLHWERLCAPVRAGGLWDFLALNQQILFSLYLPSSSHRHFPAIGRRDLRALVVVANPTEDNEFNLDSFKAEETVKGVQTSLGEIPHDILANAHVKDTIGLPTLKEIRKHLTEQHYTLLHIVAHGWFNKRTDETILYLLNDKEEVNPVATTVFLKQIESIQRLPQLTFLSTCESAAPEAEKAGALGGFAQRLVRELGIPSVIAMTDKVTIDTATTLARNFYEQLRKHGQVDRALVQACAEIIDADDSTVPVLYSRLGGRPLFSDTEDRDLTKSEIKYGLTRAQEFLPERAPIMGVVFKKKATLIYDYLSSDLDLASLSKGALREWNQAIDEINSISEEVL